MYPPSYHHIGFVATHALESLSNQSFKYNWAHLPSLDLIPKLYFEPRFYYTKSKRLRYLDSLPLFYLPSFPIKIKYSHLLS